MELRAKEGFRPLLFGDLVAEFRWVEGNSRAAGTVDDEAFALGEVIVVVLEFLGTRSFLELEFTKLEGWSPI